MLLFAQVRRIRQTLRMHTVCCGFGQAVVDIGKGFVCKGGS